ncbi:30S ribosomal protein S17 [Patescibacteria group bacterium]|nr:30S ribosomal protein S17 [Patescibacteria group bacterium]MBU1673653.1 30S ribosomal protein S17 [Patescibacteria group bacterium]MBU1963859.1 30S ribosomal protein S17 [Patescibacteria group bacterium]
MENKKTAPKKVQKRTFIGEVTSDKMDKTIVVAVKRVKTHPIYKKQYSVTRKYKVHDDKNQAKIGDVVEFVECRPMSKEKRWRLKTIKK